MRELLLALALARSPTMKTVRSTKDVAGALGQVVRVSGTARDAKLSGAVVSGELVVYCLDHPGWSARAGKPITVEGKLEQTREFEAHVDDGGAIRAGTGGPVLVIRSCQVK